MSLQRVVFLLIVFFEPYLGVYLYGLCVQLSFDSFLYFFYFLFFIFDFSSFLYLFQKNLQKNQPLIQDYNGHLAIFKIGSPNK